MIQPDDFPRASVDIQSLDAAVEDLVTLGRRRGEQLRASSRPPLGPTQRTLGIDDLARHALRSALQPQSTRRDDARLIDLARSELAALHPQGRLVFDVRAEDIETEHASSQRLSREARVALRQFIFACRRQRSGVSGTDESGVHKPPATEGTIDTWVRDSGSSEQLPPALIKLGVALDEGSQGKSSTTRPRRSRRPRLPDQPLLHRSLDDPAAFHDFYREYIDRVVVFFARRTVDAETALDLAGETFALALEGRPGFRGASAQEERDWLFAIARNQLGLYWRRGAAERSALRRLVHDQPETSSAELDWVERVADLPSLRVAVQMALTELPHDQAYAVAARVVEEREYADLAGELNVSEHVVRARVSHGLKAMARLLDHEVSW